MRSLLDAPYQITAAFSYKCHKIDTNQLPYNLTNINVRNILIFVCIMFPDTRSYCITVCLPKSNVHMYITYIEHNV